MFINFFMELPSFAADLFIAKLLCLVRRRLLSSLQLLLDNTTTIVRRRKLVHLIAVGLILSGWTTNCNHLRNTRFLNRKISQSLMKTHVSSVEFFPVEDDKAQVGAVVVVVPRHGAEPHHLLPGSAEETPPVDADIFSTFASFEEVVL